MGKEIDKILADIDIARTNLYVFKNSNEKNKWISLLDKAQESAYEKPEYSKKLINRVIEVINNLWTRIFKWKEFQKKVIKFFIFIILIELILISIYYYFINISAYGFYSSMLFGLLGGTLSVILNLGKDLKLEESNQLGILKLVLRPLIGSISALIFFIFLQLDIVSVSNSLDPKFVLIILSISAGYSERFISKTLNDYVPKIFNK
jgi:hypothetical protein